MWRAADQLGKTIACMTIGTAIVLFHATLGDRRGGRRLPAGPTHTVDGTRIWRSQISP